MGPGWKETWINDEIASISEYDHKCKYYVLKTCLQTCLTNGTLNDNLQITIHRTVFQGAF